MSQVRSIDGTTIAYEKSGEGPAIILVDGALCSRAMGPMPKLAPHLAESHTVFTYDRRGRNESGDTAPYSVQREIEDLEALIDEAGGSASLFGVSSGAALALEVASRSSSRVEKLALYEAPFIVDDSREPLPPDFLEHVRHAVAGDRRGDAVRMFLKQVGMPSIFLALMRVTPVWRKLEAVAHTLPYDISVVKDNQRGEPLTAERWTTARVPTVVFAGGKSPVWMQNGQRALATALPDAELRVLPGQTHMVKAKALAPELVEFLGRAAVPAAPAG
jgi:pimeloyl-ACP methyl ester carboxylesterase